MDVLFEISELLTDITGFRDTLESIVQTVAVLCMIPAFLQCFFGYKMLKFWIGFGGFIVVGVMGGLIGAALTQSIEGAILFAIICGVLGALVAFKLYQLGIFLLCFFTGFILGAFLGILSDNLSAVPTYGVIFALIAGIAGILLTKPVVIISTSLSGGFTAGIGLTAILSEGNSTMLIFGGLVLSALGILVQYKNNSETERAQEDFVQQEEKSPLEKQPQNKVISQSAEKFTQALNIAKESTVKTVSIASEKIKTKVQQDNESAELKAKGLSLDEVCENLEEIFFQNKFLKYVMPFAEYIVGGMVALLILNFCGWIFASNLNFLGSLSGWLTALPLACCVLILAKRKYGLLAVALTCLTIAHMPVYFDLRFMSLFVQILTALELALYLLLTILAYQKFFMSERGLALRQKFDNSSLTVSKPTSIIKVRCPACGALCDEDAKQCVQCGHHFAAQNIAAFSNLDQTDEITGAQPDQISPQDPGTFPPMELTPSCLDAEKDIIPQAQQEAVQEIEQEMSAETEPCISLSCPECGYIHSETAKFCPHCGKCLLFRKQYQ